jgi:Domain of unknown function (DUF3458_C) ARM repeats
LHHVALQDGSVEDRIRQAGGVSPALVDAYRAVLTDPSADGAFVSAAVSLPSSSELVDDIADADPLLLYEVRARPLDGQQQHRSILLLVRFILPVYCHAVPK